MECVRGVVCCSPAVHQFCSVKKSELTLGGGSVFVQRIFCGQHILHGMSVNIPGVTQLLPFIQIHFETVSLCSFLYFKSFLLHSRGGSHLQLGHPFSSCAFSSLSCGQPSQFSYSSSSSEFIPTHQMELGC